MSAPEVGDRLSGRYLLVSQIGEGSAGVVFQGRDELLEIDVAIKVLHERPPGPHEPSWIKEADIALRVRHGGLVSSYAVDVSPKGVAYLVMELLPGKTLEQLVQAQGPLPAATVIHTLEKLADALAYLHKQGILHRDIKPANVLYTAEGEPKLTDFSVARSTNGSGMGTMTQDVGTIRYAAPEQLAGHPEERSDVFSLGAVGFFMLTGEPPPAAFDRAAGFSATSSAPLWLLALLQSCLARDPALRPDSAAELRDALARGRATSSSLSRRQLIFGTTIMVAFVGGLFALQHTKEAVEIIARPVIKLSQATGVDVIGFFEGTGLRVGTRPLYVEAAIRAHDLESVRWLLTSKPSAFSDQTLKGFLCGATAARMPQLVRELIPLVSGVDQLCDGTLKSALGLAIARRDLELMEILLVGGANPNVGQGPESTPFDDALSSCNPVLLERFMRLANGRFDMERLPKPGATRLMEMECPVTCLQLFKHFGGSFNGQDANGNTALHIAAGLLAEAHVNYLLDIPEMDLEIENIKGNTAIHHLLANDRPVGADSKLIERLTKRFIARGANLNAKAEAGVSVAMFAAFNHRKEVLQAILDSGRADLDLLNDAGVNLEHYAHGSPVGEGEEKLEMIRQARVRANLPPRPSRVP